MKQSKKLWLLFTALFGLAVSSTQSIYAQEGLASETTLVSQVIEEIEETSFEEVVSTPDETEETSLEETSQIVEETTTETKEENAPPALEETTTETKKENASPVSTEAPAPVITESTVVSEGKALVETLSNIISNRSTMRVSEAQFRSIMAYAGESNVLTKEEIKGQTIYFTMRMDSGSTESWTAPVVAYKINGEYVFCLEPLVPAAINAQYSGETVPLNGNIILPNRAHGYASAITITPNQLKEIEKIGTIGLDATGRSIENIVFANLMIWENISNIRYDLNTAWSGPNWLASHYAQYQSFKTAVTQAISNYTSSPSWDGQSFELERGQSIVIDDTHNIVNRLNVPREVKGFIFERVEENKLKITATDKAESGQVDFGENRENKPKLTAIYKNPNSQTLANLILRDPVNGYLTLNIKRNPAIETTATNKEDGLKVVDPLTTVTITDAVKYTDLIVGKEYEIKGILMDKSTNKPLLVEGKEIVSTLKFVAEESNGVKNLDFTFNASALAGREVVVFEDLLRDGLLLTSHADINDLGQTVRVTEPKVGTTATNKEDGLKVVDPLTTVTITDAVKYTDLIVGKEYEIKGILMDKSTNKPLLVEGKEIVSTLKFVAKESNGVKNLDFTFNASALAGREIVVFEDLLRDGLLLTSHADINDVGQTVRVTEPKVGTTATNKEDGLKVVDPLTTVTITDAVKYTDLIVGKEYEIKGILMDKSTNKPLLVEGKEIISTLKFVAEESNGVKNLDFTFNASALAGREVVVFEDLLRDGLLLTSHADINDLGQTVRVTEPKIGTQASNANTGGNVISPNQTAKIKDVVKYTDLIVGKEYEVKGILMDKETQKALLVDGKEVTSTLKFVADKTEGEVELEFTFNASGLHGKELVVFENVYRENNLVAVHADINDKAQTVSVANPTIGTLAHVDGEKVITIGEKVIITDEVKYSGLVVGEKYYVTGWLMDKATNQPLLIDGKEVTAKSDVFVAESSEGTITMEFEVDTKTLGGKDIVVFEELYHEDGTLVAEHKDINDEGQTVKFVYPPSPEIPTVPGQPTLPNTGESSSSIQFIAVLFLVLGLFFMFVFQHADNKQK